MQEKWRVIAAFPDYLVSNYGQIKSARTDRLLIPTMNQQGFHKVQLMRHGKAHTRQVNQLVALEFLPPAPREDFISLIHLNGDKSDNRATNLDWRPRHFAIRYHQQFTSSAWYTAHIPVVDIKTGREYGTAQEAALEHGLVFTEILVAAHNRTVVWPTYQQFRLLE